MAEQAEIPVRQTSYKQIFKTTGIIGGAQVITILIKIIRAKIVAVLLGPIGLGILGLYQSILEMVRSGTGLGLGFSAVRDIAEAAGTGDQDRISKTITIFRRWVWITGIAGLLITLIFSKQLSYYTFGDVKYTLAIAVLSVIILFTALSEGQIALLQGLRHISNMAKANIFGAVLGLILTIPIYWIWGIKGIVPAMLVAALISLYRSWYYARKVSVTKLYISFKDTLKGGSAMIRLGFSMVVAGFAAAGTMYLVRTFILHKAGLEVVGIFLAAWTISTIYFMAVLNAMTVDFFPRLSAINNDHKEVIRLVNEQTIVGILISGPLIILLLSFSKIIITIFYSGKFVTAIPVLEWQLVGSFVKVIVWPIGYIILAKGKSLLFILNELLWYLIYMLFIYFFWDKWGIESTGIAFLVSYIVYIVTTFVIVKNLCAFSWNRFTSMNIWVYLFVILSVFLNNKFDPSTLLKVIVNVIVLGFSIFFSLYHINKLIGIRVLLKKFSGK
jgi:O-antigen/teichoic acid export membrane protein